MSSTEYQGHIFLSYSRIEIRFALSIAADLKNSGVHVWMDKLEGIKSGDDWRHSIQEGLTKATCAAMIAVLSPAYVTSEYCQIELARANRLKIPVYPLLLGPVPDDQWPLEIERLQYVDFTNWLDPHAYKESFKLFLAGLKARFPEQFGSVPDDVTRYLTSLIAELESSRGVLQYVELAAEGDTPLDLRTNTLIDDEWGYAELVEDWHQSEPQKIPLQSIAEAVEKYSRFVLIGEPGAGKTTTIRRLALNAARKRLENPRIAPIPLLLYLPQWKGETTPIEFIQAKWPLGGDVMELLKNGDVLLYLDGLNEMGAEGPGKANLLDKWLKSADSPMHLIVTCRAGNYGRELKLGDMPTILAQALEPDQIRQFVTNYLKEKATGLLTQIFPSDEDIQRQQFWPETARQQIEARSLLRLARNPYMLGALTYIYEHSPEGRLPRNMGALFQRLVRALWKREGIRGATSEIPLAQVERAFAQLAYAMIDEDQPLDVPLEYALAKIGSPELLWAGVNASFAIIDGEYVRFFHQLMMEYFAAVELDQKDVSSVIVVEREKAWNSTPPGLPPLPPEERKKVLSSPRGMYGARWGEKWDQVIIAVCGLTSTLDVHIREIVGVDLYLAAEWLTSGVYFSLPLYDEILMMLLAEEENSPMHAAVTVFPLLVEVRETRVIAPLIKLLVHNNYHRVGSKVSDLLIRVGTEAVPQLIEALNDADSVMRTRVAVVLGAIRDERAVPVLIERLSDDGVDGWGKPRYVGDMAAMALKSIGTKEALDAFYKWRTDLLNTVHRMGSEADSRTLWSFQELLYWNRQEIRESLDVMFNNEMIVKLCENLTWTSIEILVTMGNSAVVAELERLLTIASDRDDDQMVETIINILNRIGTPEALRAQWAAGKG